MTANQPRDEIELQDLGNGHWRAVCGDRSFRTDERNGDLWVDHRELAQFFGYAGKQGPTNLKMLLETCKKDGLVLPDETVIEAITNKNGDDIEHIAIKRKAALALAMRCTLPNAVKLARKMADVFERWLDRRHGGTAFSPDILAPILAPLSQAMAFLTRKLDQQNEELSELRKEVLILSRERGVIADDTVLWIGQQLRKIAILETGLPGRKMTVAERKIWKTALGEITVDARNEACLPITRSWKKLDPNKLTGLQSFLELRLKRAEAKDKAREPLMDWARKQRN